MGAYEKPTLYGVDYSTIAKSANEGIDAIGKSFASLQSQRKEAYDKLIKDYIDYNDNTRLERAKGLNEQQNKAIQDSVRMSVEDFSRLDEFDKQKNLDLIGDIKTAQKTLGGIIDMVSDPNVTIDKRINPEYYSLAESLRSMKNIKVIPPKEGIGMTIVHQEVDEDGNPTGKETSYDMSQIISMGSIYRDTRPVLDNIDKSFDGIAASIQKTQDKWIAAGEKYDVNNWKGDVENLYDKWTEEEKSIYYSEYVDQFGDFAPKEAIINGKVTPLSKEDRTRIKSENDRKLKEYVVNNIANRVKPTPPPIKDDFYAKEIFKTNEKIRLENAKNANKRKGDEDPNFDENMDRAQDFVNNYELFVRQQNPDYINQYLKPRTNLQIKMNGDGTFNIVKTQSKSVVEDGVPSNATMEVTERTNIPISNRETFYNYVMNEYGKTKGMEFVQYLSKDIKPTLDLPSNPLDEGRSGFKGTPFIPLPQGMDNKNIDPNL